MPHLVETYSRSTGLRIDRPQLSETFFPLPITSPYILVITSTGMPSKTYDYFGEVIDYLRKPLHEKGYKTVQAGTKDDQKANCDIDVTGKTSISQLNYLIQNASLVICGDTSSIHIAGAYNVPFVSLFSITSPKISGAYFGNKNKQRYLTPSNHKPSFNPNENPKSINEIMPERVCNEVCDLLGMKKINLKTLSIGAFYKLMALEVVPNSLVPPNFNENVILNLRYDYGGEEPILINQIAMRRCTVVTDKPINIDLLIQVRQNIEKVCVEIKSEKDLEFVKQLYKSGIPYTLITFLSAEDLDKLKIDFIDYGSITRKERFTKEKVKDISSISLKTQFRTRKVIISNSQAYLTMAHAKNQLPMSQNSNEGFLIDEQDFWNDGEFMFIFNQ